MPDASTTTPRLPNFFFVGAPKAGTTSLYHYLDQHPQIYMSPIKEPSYFASEFRPENFSEELLPFVRRQVEEARVYVCGPMSENRFGGPVTEWDDYVRLFRNVMGEIAIGEASVSYLYSKTAAANIAAKIPNAKILMTLRNPIDRAASQYWHSVTNGWNTRPFAEQIRQPPGEKFGVLNPHLEYGLYADQLQRYLKHFPRENIQIHIYEDYKSKPGDFLAAIFRFLGVDPEFRPDTSQRFLEPRVPRAAALSGFLKRRGIWPRLTGLVPASLKPAAKALALRSRQSLAMDPQDRAYLREYYREDVGKLSELLHRDLRFWLD